MPGETNVLVIPDWVKDHVPDAHIIEELERRKRELEERLRELERSRPSIPAGEGVR